MTNDLIKLGMPVTIVVGSDLYPATIVEIKTPKLIVIQEDIAERIDETGYYSENQKYKYTPNPNGDKHIVSLRKHGSWKTRKEELIIRIGNREKYRDPSF